MANADERNCATCKRWFPVETMEETELTYGNGHHMATIYTCKSREKNGKCTSTIISDNPLERIESILRTLPLTALTRYQRLDLWANIEALKSKV